MSSENSQRRLRVLPTLGAVVLVLATVCVIWLSLITTADLLSPVFPVFGSAVLFGFIMSFIARRIRCRIQEQWLGRKGRTADVITTCIACGITAPTILLVAWLTSVVWLAFA